MDSDYPWVETELAKQKRANAKVVGGEKFRPKNENGIAGEPVHFRS